MDIEIEKAKEEILRIILLILAHAEYTNDITIYTEDRDMTMIEAFGVKGIGSDKKVRRGIYLYAATDVRRLQELCNGIYELELDPDNYLYYFDVFH